MSPTFNPSVKTFAVKTHVFCIPLKLEYPDEYALEVVNARFLPPIYKELKSVCFVYVIDTSCVILSAYTLIALFISDVVE